MYLKSAPKCKQKFSQICKDQRFQQSVEKITLTNDQKQNSIKKTIKQLKPKWHQKEPKWRPDGAKMGPEMN